MNGPLSHLLHSERSLGISGFDDSYVHLRRIQCRGNSVIGEIGVHQATVAIAHLLAQYLPQSHMNAAFDLSFGREWIEGLATVMRTPDFDYTNMTGVRTDLHLADERAKTVRRAQSCSGALEVTSQFGGD